MRNFDEIRKYLYFGSKIWTITALPRLWIAKRSFFLLLQYFHMYCVAERQFFGGLVSFIGEKFELKTKIPIFWRFWPQNVTVYRPTLVMNRKIIIMFFTFAVVPYILCYLMVIFWWFGRIYCGKILLKYQNTYILTILAQNVTCYGPTQVMNRKNHYFFYFCNSSIHIVLLKDKFYVVW